MFDIASIKEIKIIKQNERQKVILTQDIDGKKYLKRVLSGDKREIYKTIKKINHPNIPKIYYIGFDEDTTIIEEYIDGITLSEFIEIGKQLNKKQLYAVTKQILSALEMLHKFDIIHKDIKPDNILIDELNHIWLADFDIARIYRTEVRRDTETMGTFGYAPIEQYGMFPTDYKTDIYSFGVTLKTLLDAWGIKGFLHKVADKCKRLDPSQRYGSVSNVKKAIKFGKYKWILLSSVSLIIISGIIYIISNSMNLIKDTNINTVSKEQVEESVTDVLEQAETDKLSFIGFDEGKTETEYSKYGTFSYVCIFLFNEPWEHIIFTDDMNKKGTIKMGENRSVINADITLHNGELNVNLDDGKGQKFGKKFKYNGEHTYAKEYTDSLRKNADIVCYDFDGDGGDELLIGLNEGAIGVVGEYFYNNFNYCMGWCVKYDEDDGFTLCDGDMFSLKYGFDVNTTFRNLGVSWENMDDIKGYRLKENKILPFY